jgi:hypothetical protein
VLVNGEPVLSCLALAVEATDPHVTTIEGMTEGGQLHPLQDALADLGGSQCGYCSPGIILTAKALLDKNPDSKPRPVRYRYNPYPVGPASYAKTSDGVFDSSRRTIWSISDRRVPIAPTKTGGSVLCPWACARAIESL